MNSPTRLRHIALALACACTVPHALATDWRRVGNPTPDGDNIYLDVNGPAREPGGHVVASLLFDYGQEHRTADGRAYGSDVRITRIDCQRERLADQSIVSYAGRASQGPVVRRMVRPPSEAEAAMEPALAHSTGQAIVWAVCELMVRGKPRGYKPPP
ncbi:surface-adhesin E family protein [Variovorax sp.]|jgi:hypothetical protein|uniref:surface-adhesin E family protein n=1 Tax=Variovorax sp. TaxID=1871043 RepID=UPI0037D9DF44